MRKAVFIPIFLIVLSNLISANSGTASPPYTEARRYLVRNFIERQGISDPAVLTAMREVPRHAFVPKNMVSLAYKDRPLPIGQGQTISQPYIVALMTAGLGLTKTDRVLEIGTGSGYQAAILSRIVKEVYTIEIKERLHQRATRKLRELKFNNVQTRFGDGYFGWKEAAPFDAIMITAAVNHIPPPLLRQLKDGGKLILPLGDPFLFQNLTLVTKQGEDYIVNQITGVLFVPMTGQALE
jgi:protein-L-isoaspartate(D-aspartate) O-methyltransferase